MAEATFSLDLHVLSPPLTFALSQDQTLHRKFEPALHRLIATVRGTGSVRCGMVSFTDRNPQSSKRLTIQFSETDRAGRAFAFAVRPATHFVEGVCLYGAARSESTRSSPGSAREGDVSPFPRRKMVRQKKRSGARGSAKCAPYAARYDRPSRAAAARHVRPRSKQISR